MDLITFFVIIHVIGAILGTGGATVAEMNINIALKDGKVDANERALMHANYWMIRVGLVLVVISGISLVYLLYTSGQTWALTSHKLWIKDLMVVAIVVNAVFIAKRWIPLWLGAAISFTSWWGATILGLTGKLPFNFLQYLFGYIVAIFVVAGILHLIRQRITQHAS